MTETIITDTTAAARGGALADATALGGVHLRVSDLDAALRFYTAVIGLAVQAREGGAAALGSGEGEAVVTLHEDRDARPPRREAGLYHVALLFPTREELARAGRRIAQTRTRIDGASDHGTHEAIYLPDPDGIGLELAADRPREQWPRFEAADFAAHGPQPLDVGALFETIDGEGPSALAAPGLRVGHVHLHVADLEASTRFYRDGLGFEVQTEMPTAAFVSAGGYHHHVAYNLWRGPSVPAAPDDALGLIHWTLETADAAELAAVRARLTGLDVPLEQHADGSFLARDPAAIAVLVR
jgi:catechol 2,3-dioxygenase